MDNQIQEGMFGKEQLSFSFSQEELDINPITLQDFSNVINPNIPNFINKGFKCITTNKTPNRKHNPNKFSGKLVSFNKSESRQYAFKCSGPEDSCIAVNDGILMFGPNKKGKYQYKLANDSLRDYNCTPEVFSLDNYIKSFEKCYFSPLSIKNTAIIVEEKVMSIPNKKDDMLCTYDSTSWIVIEKNSTFYCGKETFRNGEKGIGFNSEVEYYNRENVKKNMNKQIGMEIPKICLCWNLVLPREYFENNGLAQRKFISDDKITPANTYIAVRVNNKYQCVKDGDSCKTYKTLKECREGISSKLFNDSIIKLPSSLTDKAEEFFFNRWICPSESGLKVAVMFEKDNDHNYKIKCLGSSAGTDCYYLENAENACSKVESCEDSMKEFSTLTCGTSAYKKVWFHNGFDTPSNTWCKTANAWLRFNSDFIVVNNQAILMLPNGISACMTREDDRFKCKTGNEDSFSTHILEYKMDSSLYSKLLSCGQRHFYDAHHQLNHWCSKSLICPNQQGLFKQTSN